MGKKRLCTGVLACIGMLALILDGKTAVSSMQDGIKICVQTVVPALFPFFLLSPILSTTLWGVPSKGLSKLGKLCKMTKGSETLFIIGLISGYPVGAQLIAQAHRSGRISANSAHRMLGFCSNAGPAFIFGMLSPLFLNPIVPWALWSVHIISAILTGIILPGKCETNLTVVEPAKSMQIAELLQKAIKTTATVCSWVLIFRLILGFCQRWFLWYFPVPIQVLFSGLLELANGCINLSLIQSEWVRFLYASIFLSFGGMCVGMQTISVTKNLGLGMYFPGKLMHSIISLILSFLLSIILFP